MARYFKDRAERETAEAAYRLVYAEHIAVLESLGYKLRQRRGQGLPRKLSAAALAAFMVEHRAAKDWLAREDARWAGHLEEIEEKNRTLTKMDEKISPAV